MKFLFILIFLINCLQITSKSSNFHLNSIAKPIREILDKFLVKIEIFDFEILTVCKSIKSKWKISEILNEIKSENFPAKIKFVNDVKNYQKFIDKSFLIFFCTTRELNEFLHSKFVDRIFPKKIKIFIFSLEKISGEIKIFHDPKISNFLIPNLLIHHSFFIENSKKFLELFTTELKCEKREKISLNKFDKNSQNWEKNLENYEKFRDFFGCRRVLSFEYGGQFYYSNINHEFNEIIQAINSNFEFKSNTIEILKILGQKANFTPIFQLLFYNFETHQRTLIPWKGKTFRVQDFFTYLSREISIHEFYMSSAFYQIETFFVVTPGEVYSPYEKLLLPFDEQTWTFLILTFLIAFLVIFVVNFMPKFLREIFYGLGVRAPMFNVVGIFFGLGMTKLPANNFARIILVFFIGFCLVIRTGYQGEIKFRIENFKNI